MRSGDFTFPEQRAIYRQIGIKYPGRTVFDAGCGFGLGTNILRTQGCRPVGADNSKQSIRAASMLFPDIQFGTHDLVKDRITQKFDVVVCVEVLEHVEEPEVLLQNLLGMPRLALYLSTPNRLNDQISDEKPWNSYHVREYTPAEVISMLQDYAVRILNPYDFSELPVDTQMSPVVFEVRGF